jgi:hypothetical protein
MNTIQCRGKLDGDAELAKQTAYFIAIPATWFNDNWGDIICHQLNFNLQDTFFAAYLVGTAPLRLHFRVVMDNCSPTW